MSEGFKVASVERQVRDCNTPSAVGFGGPLLSAERAAKEVFGVSERTFHELRRRGLIPEPIALGRKTLRWSRADLETAIAAMPRQQRQPEPARLARSRIERMKATGSPDSK